MKPFYFILFILSLISWQIFQKNWTAEKHKGYTLHYTSSDSINKNEYNILIANGIKAVNIFFQSSYKSEFDVFIHPSRQSLDSAWQKDWNMPTFKSECWMVASGVGNKLDILSPLLWDKQSCEHSYLETTKTQQLITHELFHVYHGQLNISPDFSNVEGVDWFVEGLATYASGQCDSLRITEVKKAVAKNAFPKTLDNFWTGKIKYGLSGSVVMYIDYKYGREKLKELLPFNKKSEMLSNLKITEAELLSNWQNYILAL